MALRMIKRDKAEAQESEKNVGIPPILHIGEAELVLRSPDEDPEGAAISKDTKVDIEKVAFAPNLYEDQK